MYRGRLIPGDDIGVSISYNSGHSSLVIDKPASLSRSTKRIACVLVADFAVAAITRANPELRDRPFALIRMPSTRSSEMLNEILLGIRKLRRNGKVVLVARP